MKSHCCGLGGRSVRRGLTFAHFVWRSLVLRAGGGGNFPTRTNRPDPFYAAASPSGIFSIRIALSGFESLG